MKAFSFVKRLIKHGSKLVWRVLSILLPVVGYSFWQAARQAMASAENKHEKEEEYGIFPDGSPWVENSSHSQWEAYYGKDVL